MNQRDHDPTYAEIAHYFEQRDNPGRKKKFRIEIPKKNQL